MSRRRLSPQISAAITSRKKNLFIFDLRIDGCIPIVSRATPFCRVEVIDPRPRGRGKNSPLPAAGRNLPPRRNGSPLATKNTTARTTETANQGSRPGKRRFLPQKRPGFYGGERIPAKAAQIRQKSDPYGAGRALTGISRAGGLGNDSQTDYHRQAGGIRSIARPTFGQALSLRPRIFPVLGHRSNKFELIMLIPFWTGLIFIADSTCWKSSFHLFNS